MTGSSHFAPVSTNNALFPVLTTLHPHTISTTRATFITDMGNTNEEQTVGQDGSSISRGALKVSGEDTAAPVKESASVNDHTQVERDTSATRPLPARKSETPAQTETINSSHEKESKTAEVVVALQYTTLSDKASITCSEHRFIDLTRIQTQHLCRIADQILGYMAEVEEAMEQFQRYIQTQKEANQPLYKWAKYTGYRAISRAITGLDQAATKFEAVVLPPRYVDTYLSRATQLSLSVSKIAVFAMGVMNDKSTSCIDEVEASGLSAEGKANAQTLITSELRRLLKHCARATDRVYASLDLLQNALLVDYGKVGPSHTSASWLCSIASLVFGAATSVAVGLAAAHFYGTSGFYPSQHETGGGSSCTSQVVNLVQRSQAITNLTGEIYSIKLQDLDERYNQLKDVTESHGLRIDNLVEALGAPNEQGTYYTSSPSRPVEDVQASVDVRSYVQKVSSDANVEITRLHKELEQMRKNIHRMDIRLMKRLDKVDRYSS